MSSATNPIAATPAAAAAALSRVSSAELKLVSAGDDDRNVPVDTPAVHRHHSAQPEGFSWFSRTGFTNQFTKNKMLDEMITPLVYSAPYRIVYWWDPLLNAFTGRAGDIAVETLTFVAIVAYGYYNQLLSDKAAGVYTHCSGVSLADDGAVASKTTLNVTACMECAGAVDNIVYATLDPKALYMVIPDILVGLTIFSVFGISFMVVSRKRLSWDLLSRNVLSREMHWHSIGYTFNTGMLMFLCVLYITLVKDALVSPTPNLGDTHYNVTWNMFGLFDTAISNTDSHHIIVAGTPGKPIASCPQFDYLFPEFNENNDLSSAALNWRAPALKLQFSWDAWRDLYDLLKFWFGIATQCWAMFLVLFKMMWSGTNPIATLPILSFQPLLQNKKFRKELFQPTQNRGAPDRSEAGDGSGPNPSTLWQMQETVFFWRYLMAFAHNRFEYWSSISKVRGFCSSFCMGPMLIWTGRGKAELQKKRLVEEWLVESVLEGMFRRGEIVPYFYSAKKGKVIGPPGWGLFAKASALFLEPMALFFVFWFCIIPPVPCFKGWTLPGKPKSWQQGYTGPDYAQAMNQQGFLQD